SLTEKLTQNRAQVASRKLGSEACDLQPVAYGCTSVKLPESLFAPLRESCWAVFCKGFISWNEMSPRRAMSRSAKRYKAPGAFYCSLSSWPVSVRLGSR